MRLKVSTSKAALELARVRRRPGTRAVNFNLVRVHAYQIPAMTATADSARGTGPSDHRQDRMLAIAACSVTYRSIQSGADGPLSRGAATAPDEAVER